MSYNKSPFDNAPTKSVQLSSFDRSHEYKAMFQPGYLTPVLLQETLPNDQWSINTEFMFRFQPLYFPIMHRCTMRADYFYIPNRILWPEEYGNPLNPGWKKWITGEENTIPPLMSANMAWSSTFFNNNVLGFMGIPLIDGTPGVTVETEIPNLNALPLSAYLAIWDEYYRNPQLEEIKWFPLTEDQADNTTAFNAALSPTPIVNFYPCITAKWMKDYFTSALPQPQINEAVLIPLVTDQPENNPPQGPGIWTDSNGDPVTGDLVTDVDGQTQVGGGDAFLDIQATAATIRQLRLAEVLQSFYERIMKVGERYRDFLKGLWGRDPEPGNVDVPVLLGSRFGRVQIADVMAQAYSSIDGGETSSPGDYTGQANLYDGNNEWINYTCREHGWIMCILQVNPNPSYGQGIHRMWRRVFYTDYALDMFAHIGDQEILKEEVLYNPYVAQISLNQETFGYIERFGEYKYQNDIHIMQLNLTNGKSMHLGRIWDIDNLADNLTYNPIIEINSRFVSSGPLVYDGMLPSTNMGGIRITDVWRLITSTGFSQYPTDGTIFAHLFHSIKLKRSLPMYSTPDLT